MNRDLDKLIAWRRRSKPLRTTKGLSTESVKRERENRLRRKLRAECIGEPCEAQLEGCAYTGTDWHERLSRARGGSITDEQNRVWLCRPCHRYITEHPKWAGENGWSLSAIRRAG